MEAAGDDWFSRVEVHYGKCDIFIAHNEPGNDIASNSVALKFVNSCVAHLLAKMTFSISHTIVIHSFTLLRCFHMQSN